METYPLEEKCMLVITPELAAAILVQDAVDDGGIALPQGIREALDAGLTPWLCAKDPGLFEILAGEGWADVADAFDAVQNAGESDTVYCSEFTGTCSVPDGFAAYGGSEGRFDDDYIAGLVPLHEPEMFKAAYGSPEELIEEFRARLGDLAGPDVPVGRFVMDVSGTYFC